MHVCAIPMYPCALIHTHACVCACVCTYRCAHMHWCLDMHREVYDSCAHIERCMTHVHTPAYALMHTPAYALINTHMHKLLHAYALMNASTHPRRRGCDSRDHPITLTYYTPCKVIIHTPTHMLVRSHTYTYSLSCTHTHTHTHGGQTTRHCCMMTRQLRQVQ